MLVDAHAHVDRYKSRASAVSEIARLKILTLGVSMDVSSYKITRSIADSCEFVIPSFGIHPRNVMEIVDLDELAPLLESSSLIGEIGLDFHFIEDERTYPKQYDVFEYFLAHAGEKGKFVNLHTIGAEIDVLRLLKQYRVENVIVHWYSGPIDILSKFLDYGAYITIGVEISYSEHIREIGSLIPEGQLLTETDNPGGLRSISGKLGDPSAITTVVQKLAHVRKVREQDLQNEVYNNLVRLLTSQGLLKKNLRL